VTKTESAILEALAWIYPEWAYAMDLIQQVYPAWRRWLLPASIYIHLVRLEDRELIERSIEAPPAEPRLPRYKYRITPRGLATMRDQDVIYQTLKAFYRAQNIVDHARKVQQWPKLARLAHRLLVGWRCPACIAYHRGEHEGWGL